VAAIIAVLVVSSAVVATVQGLATEEQMPELAQLAGLFSPYTLADGLQVWLFDVPASTPAPPTDRNGYLFALAAGVVIAGSVVGLLARYRRATAL
jgi:ABC-2 type transport system permease protein